MAQTEDAAPQIASNCLLMAISAALVGGKVRLMRNRSGRWHAYWTDREGLAWEFAGPGASRRTYLQNLLYAGRIRRAPSLDKSTQGSKKPAA